jgi:hypothetical protein
MAKELYSKTGNFNIDVEAMGRSLKSHIGDFRKKLYDGCVLAAKEMLFDAINKNPKVPYKSGRLQRSGSAFVQHNFIEDTSLYPGTVSGTPLKTDGELKAGEITITIIFNTPYAQRVHDDMIRSYKGKNRGPGFLVPKIERLWNTRYIPTIQKAVDTVE